MQSEAPPIGLIPEKNWKNQRMQEILAAMNRYVTVNKHIPEEWISEFSKLNEELHKKSTPFV